MRWDYAIEHWTAALLADAGLVSVMGSATGWIYPRQSGHVPSIPSIHYAVLFDAEGELFGRFTVQVDVFANGQKKAQQIARRLNVVTHHDITTDLGGERWWMRRTDARMLDYPKDLKVVHLSLDYEFEALREKYATP